VEQQQKVQDSTKESLQAYVAQQEHIRRQSEDLIRGLGRGKDSRQAVNGNKSEH
jgi:hypothetical protein